jgi:hypothetical protein
MVGRLIQTTKSAYQYPLIFKQLWHTPRVQAPDQEIVYRDLKRFTYLQIKERIGRLAQRRSPHLSTPHRLDGCTQDKALSLEKPLKPHRKRAVSF